VLPPLDAESPTPAPLKIQGHGRTGVEQYPHGRGLTGPEHVGAWATLRVPIKKTTPFSRYLSDNFTFEHNPSIV
jgi:hypothetical protein